MNKWIALTVVLPFFLLACGGATPPQVGSSCSLEGAQWCLSDTQWFECWDGVIQRVSCRTPEVCQDGNPGSAVCEPIHARLGDGCVPSQYGKAICSTENEDVALKCSNGLWRQSPCAACTGNAGFVHCAQ